MLYFHRKGGDGVNKYIKIICAVFVAAVILGAAVFFFGVNDEILVQKYDIDTPKVNSNIRIAFVSDLHSNYYGENMELLIDKIDEQKPDILLLGGDLFNYVDHDENTEIFLNGISGRYPCYYAAGNHEFWCGEECYNQKMELLSRYDIKRLSGESDIITVGKTKINICGVDDPDAMDYVSTITESFESQLKNTSAVSENGNYTILLSHRPERMDDYAKYNFDLVLSGHAHGGQWRFPPLINGLYAPHQGLFPKYAGGEYNKNGTKMIVSRGLSLNATSLPRIYNRPEIVIIDLH